jgi:hypothetical protein
LSERGREFLCDQTRCEIIAAAGLGGYDPHYLARVRLRERRARDNRGHANRRYRTYHPKPPHMIFPIDETRMQFKSATLALLRM